MDNFTKRQIHYDMGAGAKTSLVRVEYVALQVANFFNSCQNLSAFVKCLCKRGRRKGEGEREK
jgi:hypothetical protein